MSDEESSTTLFFEEEDVTWVVDRLRRLQLIYEAKNVIGLRRMLAGVIDLHYESELVELDPLDPHIFILKGRAFALSIILSQTNEILQKNFRVTIEEGDIRSRIDWLLSEGPRSPAHEHMLPDRRNHAGPLSTRKLYIIASW